MEAELARPLRVFVSHTAELAQFPEKRSFVDAACAAVRRAGGVAVDMADFGARDQRSPQVCQAEVLGCDVYLGVIGFRYGTPVPGRDDGVSYTEFEFDVASQAGCRDWCFCSTRRRRRSRWRWSTSIEAG
ncbi:MAG: DUF4062 domain-containing protein [Pseudonocardiaceae bacterium]